MQFSLDHSRSVLVLKFVKQVYFRYQTRKNTYRGVILDWRQLQNLHDIVTDLDSLYSLKTYPIGGNMWLTYDDTKIQFANEKSFFQFTQQSWRQYIKTVHWQVFSYFRDEVVARDQLHADDENRYNTRPRRPLSYLRRKKYILSRSSRDARHASHQRKKYPNVSKWNGTTSRRHSHPRRRKDAQRILKEIEIDKEDATMLCYEADSEKHGSECSIEDSNCSPQLDLE